MEIVKTSHNNERYEQDQVNKKKIPLADQNCQGSSQQEEVLHWMEVGLASQPIDEQHQQDFHC
jgi:hypothetical protein